MLYSNWHPGQPNGGTSQNCMVLWKLTQFDWHDVPSTHRSGYICEMSM